MENTVKIRIKHGRIVIKRFSDPGAPDVFAEAGDVIEGVDAKWAHQLISRSFDGYPPTGNFGQPGAQPGIVRDAPIEIIA